MEHSARRVQPVAATIGPVVARNPRPPGEVRRAAVPHRSSPEPRQPLFAPTRADRSGLVPMRPGSAKPPAAVGPWPFDRRATIVELSEPIAIGRANESSIVASGNSKQARVITKVDGMVRAKGHN
jgi:hypothetical protein